MDATRPNVSNHGSQARGELVLDVRSEEHTSELQSQSNLVCRLLLEKKKKRSLAFANHPCKPARTPISSRPAVVPAAGLCLHHPFTLSRTRRTHARSHTRRPVQDTRRGSTSVKFGSCASCEGALHSVELNTKSMAISSGPSVRGVALAVLCLIPYGVSVSSHFVFFF